MPKNIYAPDQISFEFQPVDPNLDHTVKGILVSFAQRRPTRFY